MHLRTTMAAAIAAAAVAAPAAASRAPEGHLLLPGVPNPGWGPHDGIPLSNFQLGPSSWSQMSGVPAPKVAPKVFYVSFGVPVPALHQAGRKFLTAEVQMTRVTNGVETTYADYKFADVMVSNVQSSGGVVSVSFNYGAEQTTTAAK